MLEATDWRCKGYGAHRALSTLPSECFARRRHGSFWFEKGALPLLALYPDNFMFETDYPHPTGMPPGPASPAEVPSGHIARHFGRLSEELTRMVSHDNAAVLHGL